MGVQVSRFVKNETTGESEKVVTTEYLGQVVDAGSTYIGDGDSSFYTVVFDYDKGDFVKVYGGHYPDPYTVDANEELLSAYAATNAAQKAVASAAVQRRAVQRAHFDAINEAANPSKGKTVVVTKGRKVPKGTEGVVKVNCAGQWGGRVLLVLADGTEVWTAVENVEVVQGVVTAELVAA